MQKTRVTMPLFKIVGLTVRTNNANEFNPESAKIGLLVERYWREKTAAQIPNRQNPGTTIAGYTDYASNEQGDYTYFIGEAVTTLENIPPPLQAITIPAGVYQKFTTAAGKMPDVVIQAWQHIWQLSAKELGGQRAYQTDFEIYDQRACDSNSTVLDIYVGIK